MALWPHQQNVPITKAGLRETKKSVRDEKKSLRVDGYA
jgi:hypothetical protein